MSSELAFPEDQKVDQPGELKDFETCVLEGCKDIVMLLISGSTAHGEMTKYSDVDGTAFLRSAKDDKLERCTDRFGALAGQKFGKSTDGGFYEPHWSLFPYPERAIRDEDAFAEFSGGLPADFTMFNLKENSLLLRGEDLRNEFPVEYHHGMIDEWASFAPSYHLGRAKKLTGGKDRIKACYALSRSILQATRVVVWKEAECTSSSYRKIVGAFRNLSRRETLPTWALEARKRNFDVSLEEVRNKLELSDHFVWGVLREKLYGGNQP